MSKTVLWFLIYLFAGLVKCETDLFDNHHHPSSVSSFLSELIEEVKNIAFGKSNFVEIETDSVYSSMKNNISSDFTRELPETNKIPKKKKKKKTGQMVGVAIGSGVLGIVGFSLFTLVALAVVAGKALLLGIVALVMSSFSGVNYYQNNIKNM